MDDVAQILRRRCLGFLPAVGQHLPFANTKAQRSG
jgi:hypothetical protein